MTIDQIQNEIIEEFALLGDWTERYEYLIALGKELPILDPAYKTADNLIKGCQSQVWLHAEMQNGLLFFHADSDAIITKGIIALLIRVFSGQNAAEISQADLYFIDKIQLKEHLSPTRSNGLLAMVKKIKIYALTFNNLKNERN